MTTRDMFIKVVLRGSECHVTKRNGETIIKSAGANPLDSIRRLRAFIDAREQELKDANHV